MRRSLSKSGGGARGWEGLRGWQWGTVQFMLCGGHSVPPELDTAQV